MLTCGAISSGTTGLRLEVCARFCLGVGVLRVASFSTSECMSWGSQACMPLSYWGAAR